MRSLRPYTGPETQCPKCGWEGAAPMQYRTPGYCQEPPHEPPFIVGETDGAPEPDYRNPMAALDWMALNPRPERLCRTCEQCGCHWDEECKGGGDD